MSTPETPTPTITCCAAGRGWLWWVETLRLLKEAPGFWYRFGLGYIGIFIVPAALISMAATAGRVSFIANLPMVLAPCFTVGFVAAAWSQARGEMPQFSHLFSGFKADVKTLMGIGVAIAVSTWLSAELFTTLLGGDFSTIVKNLEKEKDPLAMLTFLTSASLWTALLVYVTLLSLIWMATWLAPMVVVFQRTGAVTAMLSSFKAILINWRALTIYVLVPLAASFALSLVLSVVIVVLVMVFLGLGAGKSSALILFIWIPVLLLVPLLVCLGPLTAFVAYCDIFHAKDAVFPRPAKKPALSAES